MKVLAVDDDHELRSLIAFALRQGGYLVVEAATGESALAVFAQEHPDLVLLDVNLPGIDGFEVARRLRAGSSVPILLLTVRDDESDVVRGLDLGADDYLTKPFSPRTLLARVRALLRRSASEAAMGNGPIAAGRLVLDLERHTVAIDGGIALTLSQLELRLLQLLMANEGRTMPADRLLRHLWGASVTADREQLKQVVYRLRQKLEPEPGTPRFLVTDPGAGYRLDPQGGA